MPEPPGWCSTSCCAGRSRWASGCAPRPASARARSRSPRCRSTWPATCSATLPTAWCWSIGAGEMAELVVTHLRGHGVTRFLVANRTFERAVELAERFGGDAVRYEALDGPHGGGRHRHLLDRRQRARSSRRGDMERGDAPPARTAPSSSSTSPSRATSTPAVNKVLQRLPLRHRRPAGRGRLQPGRTSARGGAGPRRSSKKRWRSFEEWLQSLAVVPTLVALREWATEVKDEELEKFLAKMPDLTDDERKKVGALAHSIVNKLLHPPTVRIKEMASDEEGYRYAEALRVALRPDGTGESEPRPSRIPRDGRLGRPPGREPVCAPSFPTARSGRRLAERSPPSPPDVIVIGSRKSPLAMTQTGLVTRHAAGGSTRGSKCASRRSSPRATGSSTRRSRASATGVSSSRRSRRRCCDGTIDLAVHSAKDVPTELPAGLGLLAFPEREDPADVFVGRLTRGSKTRAGARRVGTSSLRRRSQLLARFPAPARRGYPRQCRDPHPQDRRTGSRRHHPGGRRPHAAGPPRTTRRSSSPPT